VCVVVLGGSWWWGWVSGDVWRGEVGRGGVVEYRLNIE